MQKVKLWSWADLMRLRIVYWLRHPKAVSDGEVPAASMTTVRLALSRLAELEQDLWRAEAGPSIGVDRAGRVVLDPRRAPEHLGGQTIVDAEVLDVLEPFTTREGTRGPNLVEPRPLLRIVPGKLGGEPHIVRSRVETQALAALARRGMTTENIVQLYPTLEKAAIRDAISLETQLSANLPERRAAA